MDRRHVRAHGAPGRTSRPLSEVPASVLNRRLAHEEAPKPLPMPNVYGGYEQPTAQTLSQGFNAPWISMTTDHGHGHGHGQTGIAVTGPNEVTMADGRRFMIDGGIRQVTVSDGETFINGIPIDQIARNNERAAALKAVKHRATPDSFPLPPPAHPQSTTLPGREHVPRQTAPGIKAAQSFLRQQSVGQAAAKQPKSRSATALLSSSNSPTPPSRSTVQAFDPSNLTQSRPYLRQSGPARPAKLTSTAPTTPISRYQVDPGASTRVPGALTLSAPCLKRETGTSAGAAVAPLRQQSQGPTASTSRVKTEPGTSSSASSATTSVRPPSRLETVNAFPNATSAHSTDQAQLGGVSEGLLRSVRPPTMPSVWLPSEDGSDYGSSSEDEVTFLGMAEAQLPNMQSRPNAMAEIASLLDLPDIDVPPEDRVRTPPEMSITLMEHQKVALKWLMEQENNRSKKGGLLADTMGLGKTIEALALIVAHKPPAFSNGPKTTLIVAPLALLRQWKREIEEKLKPTHRLHVFIYHGRDKKTKNADRLHDYDIVITTYETIASEHNKRGPSGRAASPLFRHPKGFYRIILDEAHKIKNRKTACSKAVVDLRAEFRLCMTGTPFMNNTSEIFSLVRFLKIAPFCDWNHFNKVIDTPLRKWADDDKAEPMRRLQVLFRSITLRRTKDSVLDDKPILVLPKLTVTPTLVELDKEQRAYYTAIEEKQQLLVNKYLKHNKLNKVYTYILVLLLRLRQVCDHPFLIKTHGIPEEATLSSKQMVSLALRFDAKVVSRVLKKKEFVCPVCDEPVENALVIFPCGHDICPECFNTMMQASGQAKKREEDSQLGLSAFMGDAADLETKCPHDGCVSDILPNKVVCHDHFLDAHSPASASQVQELDSSDDESDACSSSGDEDEDDSDDDGDDLRGFIVSDGEEDSEMESDESEGDEDEDADEEPHSKGEEIAEPDITAQEAEGVGAEGDAAKADRVDPATGPCQDRALTPDPFAVDDEADLLSTADGEDVVTDVKHANLDLGNDVWGLILARLRQGDTANADGDSDSNSDSDLESLSAVIAKTKPTSAPAAGRSSNPATAKRKRTANSRLMPVTKKRKTAHEDEDEDEDEEDECPQKARKSCQSGKTDKKKKKNKNKKGKGKTMAELKKAASTSKAGKLKYFDRLRRDWESSAKVDVTVDLLRTIRRERPHEKVLVFSLWTSFLDLLEIPMQDEKFRYLRYDGGMTFNERDENVKTFSEDPRENILLVSLMAGNAGLNLTAASQVVIVEPFWNPFVEEQAIDRAHRIGQNKEVQVYKLLVPDSVEDRILELQEKKRSLVNTALSEKGAQGASRLSLLELRGLFGLR